MCSVDKILDLTIAILLDRIPCDLEVISLISMYRHVRHLSRHVCKQTSTQIRVQKLFEGIERFMISLNFVKIFYEIRKS